MEMLQVLEQESLPEDYGTTIIWDQEDIWSGKEGQAEWKGMGTKQDPSDRIQAQGEASGFSSQEAFAARWVAFLQAPALELLQPYLQGLRGPELGWGCLALAVI